MNERLTIINRALVDPTEGNSIGALEGYIDALVDMTIVGLSVSPQVDDAGATVDVDDDGTNIITAIDASDQNVPGTWKTTALGGGTNTPVNVAAGSKISFDINAGANGTAFNIDLYVMIGEEST